MSKQTLRTILTFLFIGVFVTSGCGATSVEQAQTQAADTVQAAVDSATQTQSAEMTATKGANEEAEAAKIIADGQATANALLGVTATNTDAPGMPSPTTTGTPLANGLSTGGKADFNVTGSPTYQPSPTVTLTPTATFTSLPPTGFPFASTPLSVNSNLDPTSWSYFEAFMAGCTPELHGAFIDRVDTLYLGVHRDSDGGRIITGSDEVTVYWTGNYREADVTHNGAIYKYCVEGDTGFYLLPPNSDEHIPTAFASVTLTGWNGQTQPRTGTPALGKAYVKANGTVDADEVVELIQSKLGEESLFADLDDIANANANARNRYGWHATVFSTAGQTFVWTRCGDVGLGWAKVTEAAGMCLYVAKLSGELEVMHPFSGINIDEPYPNYSTLPSVTASAAPAENEVCVSNQTMEDYGNWYRQADEFYLAVALLPSVIHPNGKYDTKWNTFYVTSADVASSTLIAIDQTDTSDGFRATYFGTTDGSATFQVNSAEFCLKDGAFSPADAYSAWWGP